MRLNQEQTDALANVQRARRRIEQAEQDARQAAFDAIALGVPHSRVAEAYGISRMTMWRLLTKESPDAEVQSARGTTTHGGPHEQRLAS